MFENMPPEDKPVPEKDRSISPFQKKDILNYFERFRNRPDTPKYTQEEQEKLGAEVSRTWEEFTKTKTPEAKKANEEASAKLRESKADKKHVAVISTPITAVKMFLEDPEAAKMVPSEKRKELLVESENLYKRIVQAQEIANISDELVSDVLKFMDELEIYLK